MGEKRDCPSHAKKERKLVLHVLREIWLKGDSPLRRIYSSWEELEANLEIKTEKESAERQHVKPCPICGAKQRIALPFEEVFPYQTCESCKQTFYVNNDLTVRKLSEEEKRDLPGAWVKVVEDMKKNKVAVVFGLE